MAFEYSAKEFVKVYRKLLNWEWYTDINTKTLFLHCLLRANWKAGVWHGIHYEAGEFITSLPSLARETGLSIQQARTALLHLESTGELTSRLTDRSTGKKLRKFRIITVNNWDSYQGSTGKSTDKSTDKSATNQQRTNRQERRQSTVDKEDKKYRREEQKRNIKEKTATLSADADAAVEEEPDDENEDPMIVWERWKAEQEKNGKGDI